MVWPYYRGADVKLAHIRNIALAAPPKEFKSTDGYTTEENRLEVLMAVALCEVHPDETDDWSINDQWVYVDDAETKAMAVGKDWDDWQTIIDSIEHVGGGGGGSEGPAGGEKRRTRRKKAVKAAKKGIKKHYETEITATAKALELILSV